MSIISYCNVHECSLSDTDGETCSLDHAVASTPGSLNSWLLPFLPSFFSSRVLPAILGHSTAQPSTAQP